MLLPPALGFSPCPPVSVYGTGAYGAIAAFPGTGSACFATSVSLRVTPPLMGTVFPVPRSGCLHRFFLSRPTPCQCVPAVLAICSTGISTCCPSATPPGLALGPDSPGQISFTLETSDIRPGGFPPPSRYSFRHSPSPALHRSLRYGFPVPAMLPYHPWPPMGPGLRRRVSAPDIFGAGPLGQ